MGTNKIIAISAPSGAGKTFACQHLLQECSDGLMRSVSVATRARRSDETQGVHYDFWRTSEGLPDVARFLRAKEQGYFAETQQVYPNDDGYRGTPASELPRIWGLGFTPLLDIDVEGSIVLPTVFPEADIYRILLKPASSEIWESKLRERHEREHGKPEDLSLRIAKAAYELQRGEAANFERVISYHYNIFSLNEIENHVRIALRASSMV